MKGNLFIISSPSGGGKGTLIRELLAHVSNVGYSISFTTREIRDGEVDGKDYFFVSDDDFERLIKDGELLEYAKVHGNFYGTSKSQVEKETAAGNDVILEIDVQGAEIVRRKLPGSVSIFILPPSFDLLSERLRNRDTETRETLAVRLSNAKKEVSAAVDFDYVVINDEMEKASHDLIAIFVSERLRCDRQGAAVRDILNSFDVNVTD
jgi:guanylate kinase